MPTRVKLLSEAVGEGRSLSGAAAGHVHGAGVVDSPPRASPPGASPPAATANGWSHASAFQPPAQPFGGWAQHGQAAGSPAVGVGGHRLPFGTAAPAHTAFSGAHTALLYTPQRDVVSSDVRVSCAFAPRMPSAAPPNLAAARWQTAGSNRTRRLREQRQRLASSPLAVAAPPLPVVTTGVSARPRAQRRRLQAPAFPTPPLPPHPRARAVCGCAQGC